MLTKPPATAAYDGECAFALSTGKYGVIGSPTHHIVDGGETYYFKNTVARFLWRVLPGRKEKANATWASHHDD